MSPTRVRGSAGWAASVRLPSKAVFPLMTLCQGVAPVMLARRHHEAHTTAESLAGLAQAHRGYQYPGVASGLAGRRAASALVQNALSGSAHPRWPSGGRVSKQFT
jgi:hypothetical protein